MTVQDFKTLFDYNYWANHRILDVIGRLSPEEFTKVVAGGHGSVRNTMVHVLSTEWGWLSRCGGHTRGTKLDASDYPTVESLKKDWNKVENYMRDFLSDLKDEDLNTIIEYSGKEGKKRSMPLGELLHHSIIHGAHHRGQVAVLLRELGYAPKNFDILFYYADKHGVRAW
jgi:uncharacterized damage-inducible protein DinB